MDRRIRVAMASIAAGDLAKVLRGLRGVPLFAELSDRDIKRMAKEVALRSLPAGTELVEQGEVGIGFYLVLDGQVEVRKGGRRVARLGAGEFFGEMALFQDRPRTASVRTSAPTTLAVLSRWEFWGIAKDRPAMMRSILETMARRLLDSEQAPSH